MFEDALGFHKIFIGSYDDIITFFVHIAKVKILDIWERHSHLLPQLRYFQWHVKADAFL